MGVAAEKQTLEFQTEAKQLLQLMIHSLYSNKEIFLRELISNSSDACDKLRFEAIGNDTLWEGDHELHIKVAFDKEQHTLTISDNGIGMTRDEVISNIGTIARSGTREFINNLSGDQRSDAKLIGQFGVGFYSAFIVAERVELITRRAGIPADQAVYWESTGEGSYSIAATEKQERGTQVTLHLREADYELLDQYRVSHIIKKYSDHISLPVKMRVADKNPEANQDLQQEVKTPEWTAINQASALWARKKADITEAEYTEFYKTQTYDFEEPLTHIHSHVEGKQSYISLFYIPKHAPFDLWDRDKRSGVKLYVKRIYIMEDAEHLLPSYLRFVRGVIDSDDLPLNVSREILQTNPMIEKMKSASVKKILGVLEQLATNEKDKYQVVWKEFGRVLKEGPAEDYANREQLAKLLRFSTTHDSKAEGDVALSDYVSRMKPGQKHLYYISAESFIAAKNSPHLEIFRKKEIEVLLLHDRIDEWLMSHLREFDGKTFQSVAKGDLDLGDLADNKDQELVDKSNESYKPVLERMQHALGERVREVRISRRLTNSPSCLVVDEQDMAINLHAMLKQAGHQVPDLKPIMEINGDHVLVKQLLHESNDKQFESWALILFDQALLSEGGQLQDPGQFVQRLNDMLVSFALTR